MLKEYTLKVVVQVGGETEDECDDKIAHMINLVWQFGTQPEITHEEVVEVERD